MAYISAVIITYNEERNILRCLESLQGIVDEILVVDSQSKDKTVEICAGKGARVLQHEFEGFRQQKEWAVAQAKFDWILSLDADEVLSDELKTTILKVKEQPDADGYYFNRLNNYLGTWIKHCGWYPDAKLRFWYRQKGGWKGINLHESVEMQSGTVVKKLEGDLLHYTYHSISQHLNQLNRYSEMAAAEGFAKGKRSSVAIAIFKAIWKFKRDYLFKLGFLDGAAGFQVCVMGAFAVYIKYLKIRELKRNS
jgi:glycosyltransferase involved in cell wall biosynthesis